MSELDASSNSFEGYYLNRYKLLGGIRIKVSKPSENAKMGIRSKVSTNLGLIPRVWYGNRPIFQLRDFLAI